MGKWILKGKGLYVPVPFQILTFLIIFKENFYKFIHDKLTTYTGSKISKAPWSNSSAVSFMHLILRRRHRRLHESCFKQPLKLTDQPMYQLRGFYFITHRSYWKGDTALEWECINNHDRPTRSFIDTTWKGKKINLKINTPHAILLIDWDNWEMASPAEFLSLWYLRVYRKLANDM